MVAPDKSLCKYTNLPFEYLPFGHLNQVTAYITINTGPKDVRYMCVCVQKKVCSILIIMVTLRRLERRQDCG